MKGYKILVPIMPTLSHMAMVKVAIKLFNEFRIETLGEVYRRIQHGISMTSEDSNNYPGCHSAREKLLLIPPGLRKRVMEAVCGLNSGVELWKEEHERILECDYGECIFYVRCDGTIDKVKTAQQLVLNPVIDTRKRLNIACIYCLEDDIRTLWAEIEPLWPSWAENCGNPVTRFWVRWLRDGCCFPWQEETITDMYIYDSEIKFHCFFPSLPPEERQVFFHFINFFSYDDLRLCLYAMNSEEEEIVLSWWTEKVFLSFLRWPFCSFFLQIADKIFKHVDESKYRNILDHLFNNKINTEVFDFNDIFEHFWKSSPIFLRESAKEFPYLKEKIESCLNEMERERKRKTDFDELRSCKHKKKTIVET